MHLLLPPNPLKEAQMSKQAVLDFREAVNSDSAL